MAIIQCERQLCLRSAHKAFTHFLFLFFFLLLLPPRTVKYELWKAAEEIIASCKYRGWDAKDIRWLLFCGDISNHLLGVNAAPPPRRGSALDDSAEKNHDLLKNVKRMIQPAPHPTSPAILPLTACHRDDISFATRKKYTLDIFPFIHL